MNGSFDESAFGSRSRGPAGGGLGGGLWEAMDQLRDMFDKGLTGGPRMGRGDVRAAVRRDAGGSWWQRPCGASLRKLPCPGAATGQLTESCPEGGPALIRGPCGGRAWERGPGRDGPPGPGPERAGASVAPTTDPGS